MGGSWAGAPPSPGTHEQGLTAAAWEGWLDRESSSLAPCGWAAQPLGASAHVFLWDQPSPWHTHKVAVHPLLEYV